MFRIAAIAALVIGVAVAVGAQAASPQEKAGDADRAAFQARAVHLEHMLKKRSEPTASISKKARRGPRGRRGPQGAKGAPGPVGPKGTFGSVTPVDGPPVSLCDFDASCAVQTASAPCPPGTTVVGGGWKGGGIETIVAFSAPVGNGWNVIAVNFYGSQSLNAVAMCAAG